MNHTGPDSFSPTSQPLSMIQLLQGLSEGIATLDSNFSITWCNSSFENITGKDNSALLGQSITTLFPNLLLSSQIPPTGYNQEVASGYNGTLAVRIMPSVDEQGQAVGSVVLVNHLSKVATRQAEAPEARPANESPSLNAVKETLTQQINHLIPCLITLYNGQTGQYLYVNPPAKTILGYEPDEILAKGVAFLTSLVHPDDFEGLMLKNQEAMRRSEENYRNGNAQPGEVAHFAYRLRHADGNWRWLHTSGTVFDRDENGQVLHILTISIDITDRKETEEKLRESQQFIRKVADATPDVLYVYDLIEHKFLYINREIYEKLGYTREAFFALGSKTIETITHPEDLPRRLAHLSGLNSLTDGEVAEVEYRIRKADGDWLWVRTRDSIFKRNPKGIPAQVIGVVQDVTEQRKTENTIHAKNQMIDGLLANFPFILTRLDRQGNITESLGAGLKLLGLEDGMLVGKNVFKTYTQPLNLEKALKGESITYEGTTASQDGIKHYFQNFFFPDSEGGAVGFSLDITEQRQIEGKLAESQRFVQQIADASPDHLYVFDLIENKLIYINREITDSLGYEPDALYHQGGNIVASLIHPEDIPVVTAHLTRFSDARDGDLREVEYRIKDVNDQWHWLLARETVFKRDEQGNPVQITGVSRDITSKKQAEQKLKENEEQLRSLNAELERRVAERTKALTESEERYRIFLQQSSEAIWRFELEGIGYIPTDIPEQEQIRLFYQHGYLAECNDTMARMYGFEKAADIVGVRLSDLIPTAQPANIEYLQKFIRSNYRLSNSESVELDRTGQVRYFLNNLLGIVEDNKLYRAWGTQRDITDRKQAEEALKEKELEYRSLVTATAQIIWHTDGEGQVVEPQPLWERYTGQNREELRGSGWIKSVHPEDAERVAGAWNSAVERQQVFVSEFRIRSKEEEYRWFSVRGVPVFSKHGTVRKWVGTCSDIHERRTAMDALRESEERLNLAVKAGGIGIFDWHIPSGKVLWSEQEQRIFGLPLGTFEENIAGWSSRVHPEDVKGVQQNIQAAIDSRAPEMDFQFRILRPDGEIRWIMGAGRFVYALDGSASRMVGVNIDVTERQQAENAIRRSEARFRRLFESNVVGIIFADATGLITDANNAFLRMIGYSREELLSGKLHWNRITPPEYAEMDKKAVEQIMGKGVVEPFEKEYFRQDGSRVSIIIGAAQLQEEEVGTGVGVVLDISEQKKARQQLALSEERFRLVAKATNEGIWDWDIITDKVWRNDNYYTIFGYNLNSLSGTYNDFDARIHPDDAEAVRLSIGEAFHHRQDYWSKEYRIQRADGRYAYILDRAYILYDELNQPVRMIGSKLDLSQQQITQAALEKQALELKRYNADLEQFAYISSHDLQEPLNIASSFAKLLKRRYYDQLDQDGHDFIDYIVNSTGIMRQMIRALLEYSRISSTNKPKEYTDLAEILPEVLKNLQDKIEESKAVVEHSPMPRLYANPSQIVQLLTHLLDNALKFRSERPLYIRISLQEQLDSWLFAVSDTGIGMDMQDAKDRIFQVFQRLHPREIYPGTGVGLAVCKRIVERHGGTIWAESQPGQGSVFYFTLKKEAEH